MTPKFNMTLQHWNTTVHLNQSAWMSWFFEGSYSLFLVRNSLISIKYAEAATVAQRENKTNKTELNNKIAQQEVQWREDNKLE